MRTRRLLLSTWLVLCALVPMADATWSIVVVDRRTGEVCIASATCIPRIDLTTATPVILAGVGGGVTQAVLDNGENKLRVWEGFLAGDTPQEILARIQAEDPGVATRQFGIVDFTHDPLSFTGSGASAAKKSVTGSVDDLVYAIQGNVLVSRTVIDECVATLRASPGDLGQRVLAAMVRARELGGDGRCSCGIGSLGNCGTPAPDFEKSAHIGFLIVARLGDSDGSCAVGESCADGSYYLRLSIFGPDGLHASPDPVDQLVERYAEWRAERRGHPDGVRSRVETVDSLPADGATERTLTLTLLDVDGERLTHGGATVAITRADGGPALTSLGPVSDHGDGSYSFPLVAGKQIGSERFVIRVDDGFLQATLAPYLELRSEPARVLHAGVDRLSVGAPRPVPYVVNAPTCPDAKYWLFARLAGLRLGPPGLDAYLRRFLVPARAPFFPAAPGLLDRNGRAEAEYTVPAGALVSLIGLRLEWSARIFGAGKPLDSNTVGFELGP